MEMGCVGWVVCNDRRDEWFAMIGGMAGMQWREVGPFKGCVFPDYSVYSVYSTSAVSTNITSDRQTGELNAGGHGRLCLRESQVGQDGAPRMSFVTVSFTRADPWQLSKEPDHSQ